VFSRKNYNTNHDDAKSTFTTIEASNKAVICEGVKITGDIEADCDLELDGVVTGNVKCRNLVMGDSGVIDGDIDAVNLTIAKSIKGNVTVSNQLIIKENTTLIGDVIAGVMVCEGKIEGSIKSSIIELKSTSNVKGNCTGERIIIEDGAIVNGKISIVRK